MYWNTTHQICQILTLNPGNLASISGRVTSFRRQGGIAFGHIQDKSGKIQICFQKRILGDHLFKLWTSQIKIGVHIGCCGSTWKSSTGEQTLLVGAEVCGDDLSPMSNHFDNDIVGDTVRDDINPSLNNWEEVNNFCHPGNGYNDPAFHAWHPKAGVGYCFRLLQNVWRGFPDKVDGVTGNETRQRLRYLSSAINQEERALHISRAKLVSAIRSFLSNKDFLEIETPVLAAKASGAMAKPFVTHHNALDSDMFLRIAPETYLKRAVAAGVGSVFEIGKQFRNEGIDPSHLQEFTSLEWYWQNANYTDNLKLFRTFLETLGTGRGGIPDEWKARLRQWATAPAKTYRQVFAEHTNGQSPDNMTCKEADELFKRSVRPNLKEPLFIVDYPAHMSPMAARKDNDSTTVEQWQFVVEGWELVKCYTELTDPELQRTLLENQAKEKASGENDEAMDLEEDFLECMEYGMPPMAGVGMGIDRLVCLLAGLDSLRDTLLFPMLLSKHQ